MATKKGAHSAPGSKWYATPEKSRKRKRIQFSLGVDATAALDEICTRFDVAQSRAVCAALLELAALPESKIKAAFAKEQAAK